jgi:ThiF family
MKVQAVRNVERSIGNERFSNWRPLILDAASPDDRDELARLMAGDAVFARHDTMREQLCDLFATRRPGEKLENAALDALVTTHLAGRAVEDYGKWIYYPWSGQLVHLLPKAEFWELRSDRNRDKITQVEQHQLRRAIIGVIGLSVGRASAETLALEGVGGHFRIADFDRLALSNLNRLTAGVHELGINKAVLAARQMFEIDPYLEIEIFPEGLDENNLAGFLGEGATKLSILVEECDDFFMKILARQRARERRIPVVMDTSDRGLIDIERFDLEPERPLLHGLLKDVDASRLRGLTMSEKFPYVMQTIGEKSISRRLAQSMPEIKRTLSAWPQLASDVALGGALVANVVRRILLGEMTSSGRFYVDIDAIISDDVQPAP